MKESKALDDALQAGMDALDPNVDYSTTNEDPDYKGHEQTAYDAIKAKLGDPGATKYQYVKSGSWAVTSDTSQGTASLLWPPTPSTMLPSGTSIKNTKS